MQSNKGRIKPGERKSPKTEFKKGHKPWSANTKGLLKANSGSIKKGEHRSKKTEFKKGENLGEEHPNWKGGRYKLKNGYVVVKAYGHPKAYRNKVYEHRLVAEKKLGRYLKPNERVHHINGIKDDNRPSNIVVCSSAKDHFNNHRKYDRFQRGSEPVPNAVGDRIVIVSNKKAITHEGSKCVRCKKLFWKTAESKTKGHCSRGCGNKKDRVDEWL